MINYNPKEWFTFIFRLTKADTFRMLLPLMAGVAIYTWVITYLELNYFQITGSKYVRNISIVHNVLGFVISLLLVFRTNTAYDRWWEGRKIWGGLTNSSRNLAIKINAFVTDKEDKKKFRQMIPNFAFAVKNLLRGNEDLTEMKDIDNFEKGKHLPNQIANVLFKKAGSLNTENKITGFQLQIINEEIKAFTDLCGACERIKNTPIPFTYSVFIKKFIFFFVMTLPFGWTYSLGYFTIPAVVLILYVLASLELIAEEIENPFGSDANDLPLDQICKNINKHVGEILD